MSDSVMAQQEDVVEKFAVNGNEFSHAEANEDVEKIAVDPTNEQPMEEIEEASVKVDGVLFVEGWWMYQLLGEGAFGEVRLLKNEKGESIAMKIVDLKKPNVDPNDIKRETAIHKELKHKNILRLFGTREEASSNTVYMFLEFAEGGDLLNQIEPDVGIRDWSKAARYFVQLVRAVKYLHSLGIVHRDLKAENILLDKHDDVKLADFGCATVYRYRGTSRRLTNAVGTYSFMSPECFACSSHSQRVHNRVDSLAQASSERSYEGPATDCWSLGVVLLTMHFGEVPFHAACECQREFIDYRDGRFIHSPFTRLFVPNSTQNLDNLAAIARGLLTVDSTARMTIDLLEKTAWFSEHSEALNERDRDNELLHRVAYDSRKRSLVNSVSQPLSKVSRFAQLTSRDSDQEQTEGTASRGKPASGNGNTGSTQPASFAQLVCSSQCVPSSMSQSMSQSQSTFGVATKSMVRLERRMTRIIVSGYEVLAALNLVRESLRDFGTFEFDASSSKENISSSGALDESASTIKHCPKRFAVVTLDEVQDAVANVAFLRVEIVPTASPRSFDIAGNDRRAAVGSEPIRFTVTPIRFASICAGDGAQTQQERVATTLLDFRLARGDGLEFKRAYALIRDSIKQRVSSTLRPAKPSPVSC